MNEQVPVDRAFMNNEMHNLQANGAPLTPYEDWLGQNDWEAYLASRPDAEKASHYPGTHYPVAPEVYFDAKEKEYYERTLTEPENPAHRNPAELSATQLFDRYIGAETERNRKNNQKGNQTFVEDYSEALAEKLDDKELELSQLVELLAEAEFESEISKLGAPRTTALVSKAVDKRVAEFREAARKQAIDLHNSNL